MCFYFIKKKNVLQIFPVVFWVWITQEFMNFVRCGKWMHFRWKQWKIVDNWEHIKFCFANCEEFWKCGSLDLCMLVTEKNYYCYKNIVKTKYVLTK